MSTSGSSLQKTKFQKKRLTQDQVRVLEASFNAGKKLEPELKFQLARQLGVPPRQIAIWYQNKRARWKNQSMELDYSALQLRLEVTLADNKQLERQVENLRVELQRAQDAAVFSNRAPAHVPVPQPYYDGGAGRWGNGEALELEELYACLLLGTNKGSNYGQSLEDRDFVWL